MLLWSRHESPPRRCADDDGAVPRCWLYAGADRPGLVFDAAVDKNAPFSEWEKLSFHSEDECEAYKNDQVRRLAEMLAEPELGVPQREKETVDKETLFVYETWANAKCITADPRLKGKVTEAKPVSETVDQPEAASVTILTIGYRARCTAPQCKNLARVIRVRRPQRAPGF